MARRAVPVVSALLALASLAACSSPDEQKDAAGPGPSGAAATTTSPAPGTGPGTPTGSPSGTASASSAPRTGGTTGGVSSPAAGGASPGSATVRSTAPGTYTYDSRGSQTFSGANKDVDASSTLTVGAVSDGRQTSTLHNSQGDTTQQLVVRSTGTYLASLAITSPTLSKEFRFDPAALLLPDPARVGTKWSWRTTSTDGTTTVTAANEVLRTETVTVGGERVPTVVLRTHLVITGKDVTYTADATNWVSPAHRLPVKTHTAGRGTYGAFAFSFDVTDVVRSVRPS